MKSTLLVKDFEFTQRDFVGGDVAIDFINTVSGRDAAPRDRVDGYARLLEWAEHAALLPASVLRMLARKAQREPAAAQKALTAAKELRESLFSLATDIASNKTPRASDLELLRQHWVAGCQAHELDFSRGKIELNVRQGDAHLELIASMVAYRMVVHVLSQPMDRLRVCAGPDCAWLFIDTSKAGRRRWCDMAVCGNSAKSRRFHARAAR